MNFNYSPKLSIDCVIFGFHNDNLKLLILKYKNTDIYGLPGGFIQENENADQAANRILKERTGVKDIYLEQFGVFAEPNRINNETIKTLVSKVGLTEKDGEYLNHRFVSIGYLTLIDHTKLKIEKDSLSSELNWYDIENLPKLMHDHPLIVIKAREALCAQLFNKAVGKTLMPDQFTMKELQELHEAILGTSLIRTNFQRKMLSLDILNRIDKKITGKAHKAPYLYQFK